MLGQESSLLSFLIYFIYGLAFFVMGIALILETSRSPSLTEARLLWPLAVFGVLHGLHEWFEFFLQQASWMDAEISDTIVWVRMGLLAISPNCNYARFPHHNRISASEIETHFTFVFIWGDSPEQIR